MSGRYIVDGLLNGRNPEEILDRIPPSRIRATKEEILGVIHSDLSPSQIFLIQSHLNIIENSEKPRLIDIFK